MTDKTLIERADEWLYTHVSNELSDYGLIRDLRNAQTQSQELIAELVKRLKAAAFEIAQDEPSDMFPDLVNEWQQTEQYLLLTKIDLTLEKAKSHLKQQEQE